MCLNPWIHDHKLIGHSLRMLVNQFIILQTGLIEG